MKLFQQLLVAPAALGLLAPVAAHAADFDLSAVADYSPSKKEQVTSVTQFSDVFPTDWAYQALSNLVEQYGCVAGYPNGTFRGNRAMTRYEAAALLNACLDRITEVTDELRRLMKEFDKELAIVRGRIDGLEAKVGELEATQFSTTTKLKGKATFVTGAISSEEDADKAAYDALSFSYDLRLGLKTSFTGKDLLFTRLRGGNMKDGSAFSGGLRKLDVSGMSGNMMEIDRLYYRFPVAKGLTAIAGPLARNTESLGMKPSAYKVKTLNMFGGHWGTPGVYNKETGGLVGLIWKQKVAKGQPKFTASLSYVADAGEAENSDPTAGGMFTANSRANTTAQIGYGSKKFGVAFGYRYGRCKAGFGTGFFKAQSCVKGTDVSSNNFALNGFWKPSKTGLIPSISAGYGFSTLEGSDVEELASWMVGFQWDKLMKTSHKLAIGFGAPQYVVSQKGDDPDAPDLAFEASVKLKVADKISVIPAVFYLPEQSQGVDDESQWGGVVQTVFKF
jgi:hypothetical protein